jgi:hypothetical protein
MLIMRTILGVVVALSLSLSARAGEIDGVVKIDPGYWLEPAPGTGRPVRLALPPLARRVPAGVIVALDGGTLSNQAPDKQPIRTIFVAGGFEPPTLTTTVGSVLEIENQEGEELTLAGDVNLAEPIPVGGKRSLTFAEPGVVRLFDKRRPAVALFVVVGSNPYLTSLDETGEFVFADLDAGKYQVKLFLDGAWVDQRDLIVGAGKHNLTITLPRKPDKP